MTNKIARDRTREYVEHTLGEPVELLGSDLYAVSGGILNFNGSANGNGNGNANSGGLFGFNGDFNGDLNGNILAFEVVVPVSVVL